MADAKTFGERDRSFDDESRYIDELRRYVDNALEQSLFFSSDCPSRLVDAMRYSLLAPGKRLRPILVLLTAELCGGVRQSATPAAVAVEAIHAYSLIHDDLPAMDDDDLRRGRPTCHRKFDEATAILAGDALQTFAFDVLSSKVEDASVALRCVRVLSSAAGAIGMVGGQVDDVQYASLEAFDAANCDESLDELALEFEKIKDETFEDELDKFENSRARRLAALLHKIHRRKTGALLTASVQLGAICGRADEKQFELLSQFGRRLGQAFQIADDLLDVTGIEELVGKRVGKDADAHKLTYPAIYGVDASRRILARTVKSARERLEELAESSRCCPKALQTALYLSEYVARRDR